MDNGGEVLDVISIGLVVACFLFNSSRVLKAIQLCKECLFILKTKAVIKDEKLDDRGLKGIYLEIVKAYFFLSDYTNAIKYARKLLRIHRDCGEKHNECKLCIQLAIMYLHQSRYVEAKELCEKVLPISIEINEKKVEAYCYGLLGTVSHESTSEYEKAMGYHEKALAIFKQIGDRNGEATCYGNLGTVCETLCEYDNAREYLKEALAIQKEMHNKSGEAHSYINLGTVYQKIGEHKKARSYLEDALAIKKEVGDRYGEAFAYRMIGIVFESVGEYDKAREYYEKALSVNKEIGYRNGEASCYENIGTMLKSVGEYEKAKAFQEKALAIKKEIGDKDGVAFCYINLGTMLQYIGNHDKAREYLEEALAIQKEIGDAKGKAFCYRTLGTVYYSLRDFAKSREYLEKALAIKKEIGDKNGEAFCYKNLGTVYRSFGKFKKAKEYVEKAIMISKEIGDRDLEALCWASLGTIFESVGDYERAREYLEKALSINKEIGDRNTEAACLANLGTIFQSVGDYEKAREYLEKALAISKEIGARSTEASCWANLGDTLQSLGDYDKAKEYFLKALTISKEIGDRNKEASCWVNLGNTLQTVGNFEKAREYYEKALAIHKGNFDKGGEASCWGNLGIVLESVGEYEKARQYYEKALVINKEIGDRNREADCYENLGALFQVLGKYANANEYLQKALKIRNEIGDRRGKASSYGNLGNLFLYLGDFDNAKDYHKKSLAIRKDICDRKGEALNYLNLGTVFQCLGECDKAEKYYKEGLSISEEISDEMKQFSLLCKLAWVKLIQKNIQEALSYLLSAVQKCEDLRGFLRHNDQFQISFTDTNASPYWLLSSLFCDAGNLNEALYVSELGRARALADLMSAQYSVENQISANPQTWVGIEKVMTNECKSTCLYVSYSCDNICLWILKANGVMHFRRSECQEDGMDIESGLVRSVDDFFVNEIFRCFCILAEENCEDRSLNGFQREPMSCEQNCYEASRIGKDDKDNLGPKVNLSLCYKLIIAPVVDLLDGSEIIIVPDRSLYNIPFAALTNENGKYLSEAFRIRIAPSLTTLKLVHDSPVDYHSQTGALIVGNPEVGEVHFKGRLRNISRLPCAENEAKMVAGKLGVKPLLGQQATKQAVLEVMNSVCLIHFAAHGDAERGEIALAPAFRIPKMIPQEEHYLLTMSDISKVQLRAKLVVLSCCHSARGQIRAEGVVGIARAFLGSGARSVLVAQWALDDSATEQFMSHFYEHLVCGESASESLHEAMKWMRCNGYSDVRQWAPFMLIGDNVTFDFGK
ncbi:uncharacterized protein LOC144650965 [Oculina patagonica]